MHFITAHIYKPKRILYYIETTSEVINDFYLGIIPDELSQYENAFGTYDIPGLFILKTEEGTKTLLGIEFRPDDPAVNYPTNLKSINLEASFMVSALDTEDRSFDDELISSSIAYLKEDLKNHQFQHGIQIKQQPEIIQFFSVNNTNRLYIQADALYGDEPFNAMEAKTENEIKLAKMAYHDLITEHYNWNFIWPVIAGFGLKGIQDFAFAHFDIKDYKAINIVYGHGVANEVLKRVVEHMKKQDWIYYSARCDNDNFAMMIKDMPDEELKARLHKFFAEISILPEDKHYHIYYRCGVVPMRKTLLLGDRVADAGKQVQRMCNKSYETEVQFYTDEMHDELEWTTKIKAYLDTAIENDEFLVYLQPKYDIQTETVYGAEALIRWKYHNRELLPPAKFVPIFENGGLISKLDDIVLRKVCEKFKQWKNDGLPLHPISVNLSRKRMANPNLVEHLTAIVDSYNVEHSLIDFELTESAAFNNQRIMINTIMGLKEKGFKISMDDFGTGYSSLSLLTTMPMDTIKIDKSFIDEIGNTDEQSKVRKLIKNIIRMAKELNFTCLTEGAETKSQIEKLREYGCEIVQGYYYSKPLPFEKYEKLLADKSKN